MRANSWLYHYYMVQSRLQYGLAYGAHTPGLAAYYPQMLGKSIRRTCVDESILQWGQIKTH